MDIYLCMINEKGFSREFGHKLRLLSITIITPNHGMGCTPVALHALPEWVFMVVVNKN